MIDSDGAVRPRLVGGNGEQGGGQRQAGGGEKLRQMLHARDYSTLSGGGGGTPDSPHPNAPASKRLLSRPLAL